MDIDRRTKELIAIGAAVGANCTACLEYHLSEARQAGLEETDLAQATEIGKAVRKGAAAQLDKVAAKLRPDETTGATSPARGCCR